jgi:hypothetical protein
MKINKKPDVHDRIDKQAIKDIEMILSTTMNLKNTCLKETLKTNLKQEYASF